MEPQPFVLGPTHLSPNFTLLFLQRSEGSSRKSGIWGPGRREHSPLPIASTSQLAQTTDVDQSHLRSFQESQSLEVKSGSPGQLTTSVMSSQAERSWTRPSVQGQHLIMEAKSVVRVCDTRKDKIPREGPDQADSDRL